VTVYFIGAGPGAADLITVRGQRLIEQCPVCLYAGSLVPAELLECCPAGARLVNTAELDLDQIIGELVAADRAGHDIARLHSGDLAIFSAVAEQVRRIEKVGIDYQMVPGVPAFAAAAAVLKRELTVPTVGQTVILTRVAAQATAMPAGEELDTLGRSGALLVVHLAMRHIDRVVAELVPRYGMDCPVAVVAMASRPHRAGAAGNPRRHRWAGQERGRGAHSSHHGRAHVGGRAVRRQLPLLTGPRPCGRRPAPLLSR